MRVRTGWSSPTLRHCRRRLAIGLGPIEYRVRSDRGWLSVGLQSASIIILSSTLLALIGNRFRSDQTSCLAGPRPVVDQIVAGVDRITVDAEFGSPVSRGGDASESIFDQRRSQFDRQLVSVRSSFGLWVQLGLYRILIRLRSKFEPIQSPTSWPLDIEIWPQSDRNLAAVALAGNPLGSPDPTGL